MDSAYRDTYSALLLIMKNIAGHLPESERAEMEEPLIKASRSIPRLVVSGKQEDIEKAVTNCNEAIVALSYCRDNHPQRVNKNICNHIIEIYERSIPLICLPEAGPPPADKHAPSFVEGEGAEKKNPMGKLISLLLASSLLLLASCQPAHNHAKTARGEAGVIARSEATKQSQVNLSPVHFPTGSDVFLNEELNIIDSNVLWLEKNPKAVLVLEGHCDERGGDKFNMQLGDRRARRIKSQLIGKGIASDRLIMVVSYGARAPLDPRHTPDAWNKNRRVEFIVR